MEHTDHKTVERLLDKSQEAFILAIELYNRPSIRYHVEGCTFFLCNAWELMLKAHLIKTNGAESIFYPGNDRTLSLSDCLKRTFTNDRDPVRTHMDILNELRNTSTHFVVDEYELFFGPILQVCVEFFEQKLSELHKIEISDRIPENYLALSVRRGDVDLDVIRARYSREVVEKLLSVSQPLFADSESVGGGIGYATELRLTKKGNADHTLRIASDGEHTGVIVKSLINPISKYKYRTRAGAKEVNRRLLKEGIKPYVRGEEWSNGFTSSHFSIFVDFYQMKTNERYGYNSSLPGEAPSWSYSDQALELMFDRVRSDPEHVIDRMNEELAKRRQKESRPQEQGNSKA